MKKIKLFLFSLICLFSLSTFVNAASISVSANTKTVIVGNTVKVTVTVDGTGTSDGKVGAWEYCISYDSSLLKLTNSTADANTCVKAGVVGQTNKSATFTFKALKSGSAKVTLKSYALYDYGTEEQMKTTVGSVTIKTMTQAELEATYSTNANLKSIKVDNYELSPTFNKGVFEYTVEVENDVESVTVSATKDDSLSTISGTGTVNLTEGQNKVEILVTSQKGNTLTYTVNIYRKELNPIKVTVDNKSYTIIRKAEDLPIEQYSSFQETTIQYDSETEIPALYSDITYFTIIGLKDDDGNIRMFIYDNDIVEEYHEVKTDNSNLYTLDLPESEKFDLYTKTTININGLTVQAYKLTDEAKTAIIYAQDVDTGATGYYIFDLKEQTIISYNTDLEDYFANKLETYKYVIFGLIGVIIFLVFLHFIRRPKIVEKTVIVHDAPIKPYEPEREEKEIEKKEEPTPSELEKKENIEATKEFNPVTIKETQTKKRGRPAKKKETSYEMEKPSSVDEIKVEK